MSLIRSKTFIKVCCAAQLLNLSESALLKGVAGTETLTRIPQGKRISFILEEIIDLKIRLIEAAQRPQSRNMRLIK